MPHTRAKKITRTSKNKTRKNDDGCYRHLDIPSEVALYYGFTPMESPTVTKDDTKKARAITEPELRGKDAGDLPNKFILEEKVALMRLYNDHKLENAPQPVLLYFGKPIVEEGIIKKATKDRTVYLEALGAPKSIAEALLIKTAIEILKAEKYEGLSVHLNSIGDKETIARYTKELTAYYRKNIETLPTHCRQLLKKDVFDCLSCQNEKCRIVKDSAPRSMNFLSEPSRAHFREILEYLEILDVPYAIDQFLVGNRAFACQTLFEIHTDESKKACAPLAVGVRYNNVAKKLGAKRDVPGLGVRLTFREKSDHKNLKFQKPQIYFIQLGLEAKLKSLKIIEILREAKIPIYHAIARDKLISQLGTAENMKIPYTIIMGQKEAIEDSVIVRDMSNRSQETVKIANLAHYLKKIF